MKTRNWIVILALVVISLEASRLFIFSRDQVKEQKAFAEEFHATYKVYPPEIPQKLTFAGEPVPLDDFNVKERLEREFIVNTFWQSSTMLGLKMANRYFPIIEPILKEEGVPDDFKYLAWVESSFRYQVSPMGAAGFWQFLENTAPDYGMQVNDNIDERYHLEKATHAACIYLKQAHDKFGSWTLAAASYNRGMQGIQNQIELQSCSNYYDLYLNDETSRYLFRMLALREIHNAPEQYGYMIRQEDLYPPVPIRKVAVDSSIASLPAFAKLHGIKYKTLKLLNPWLKNSSFTNPKKETFYFDLPEKLSINKPFFLPEFADSLH
ncbi:MAG: lytic transglycosylase domain-containing protein [Flavobacteriales bacterium]|nr:lytic transglycosylase domain-containing protein [Flavobacteriales bacterium]MCB9448855.1 lytic transglycosylase domain-containing protein [Flavobacteriales bacterium]